MLGFRRWSWFSLFLFGLTLAVAGALLALVFLAPLLDKKETRPAGWERWLSVFAQDQVLRRTAVGSALCLAVTAFVFFRPPSRTLIRPPKRSKLPKLPPSSGMAGA